METISTENKHSPDRKEVIKVSVIITCYNYAHYLWQAIESVLAQNKCGGEVEIVVVNDGSTDNTIEVAEKYPVCLINQENQGVSIARNVGIERSHGQFILPLDADDKLHPQYLEKTVPILELNSDVGVVYTHRRHFGIMSSIRCSELFQIERLKEKCILNYCSLYRREIWKETGGYNANMKWGYEDWNFWLGVAERDWKFRLVPEVLFYYRIHYNTMRTIARSHHHELIRIMRNNHPNLFFDSQI